jgi:hypothetical protein
MLQVSDGAIREVPPDVLGVTVLTGDCSPTYSAAYANHSIVGCIQTTNSYYQPYTTWYGYPVYACTDKTKKAIEVLKTLQAEKLLKCDSVPRFIALVEKISALL